MSLADPCYQFRAIYYKYKPRQQDEETPLLLVLSSILQEINACNIKQPIEGFTLKLLKINNDEKRMSIKIGNRLSFIPISRYRFQSEDILKDIRDFFNSNLGDIYEAHITTDNELEVNFK